MKKIIIVTISLIFILVLSFLLLLFMRPGLLINPKNLSFVLHKTSILKSWSWKKAVFTHEWKKWNDRNFSGSFENLCLNYAGASADLQSCMEVISWDINIRFDFRRGFYTDTNKPFFIRSSRTMLATRTSDEPSAGPPDIWKYWSLFWSELIPDMDFKFNEIQFKNFKFDLSLIKEPRKLTVNAMGFTLNADPETFLLSAPTKYELPKKLPYGPLYFYDVKLAGKISQDNIPLKITGRFEPVAFNMDSLIELPLKTDNLLKSIILATKGELELLDFKSNVRKYGPKPYNQLPAPFNSMNGSIKSRFNSVDSAKNEVVMKSVTKFDLKGSRQVLNVDLSAAVPFDVISKSPGKINIDIDFNEVVIQLPKLSKKSPPPQFMPDSRFKKKAPKKEGVPYVIDLEALEEEALHISTNLLDEPLRLNFNLSVKNGELQNGFLKILPLKTTVFKRPIRVEDFLMRFNHPEEPVLDATIKFPLPEYKVTLKLEGPVSKPRYAFESVPPLPKNDIYAVLLFGRPLADLDPDDKTAATRTNQILSQGILSLSVLYFLAGSPVEYVGYDPESKNATAQFGLGRKSSLRVGGGSEGVNSTAIRRSLGKGWYIDTSVQNTTNSSASETKDYGVLLERIISY